MQTLSNALSNLSPAVLLAILVLVALQLILQVYGLVDLSRRDLVPGGRKWVWVLVIILGNLLGAIIYLAVGRTAPGERGTEAGADRDAAQRALDKLYGGKP